MNRLKPPQTLLFAAVLVLLGAMSFLQCTKIEPQQMPSKESFSFDKPLIVELDTCPLPKIIHLKDTPNTQIAKPAKLELPTQISEIQPQAHLTQFDTFSRTSSVSCGLRDHLGRLWFGTYGGGISRYDGKKFIKYTTREGIANNSVLCITEDYKGNIWFVSETHDIFQYNGKRFKTFGRLPSSSGFPRFITADQNGKLWIGTTTQGVFSFDGRKLVNFDVKDGLSSKYFIGALYIDKKNKLWVGTFKGVDTFDGQKFSSFELPPALKDATVLSITEDSSGCFWFGTSKGACKYDGKNFTLLNTNNGLSGDEVVQIFEDQQHKIWINTYRDGICIYDGKRVTPIDMKSGLPSNEINCIIQDLQGSIWLGTGGQGVVQYHGQSLAKYSPDPEKKPNVNGLAEDKNGNLWMPTDRGISCYDGKETKSFADEQGFPKGDRNVIFEKQVGMLWLDAANVLTFYDGENRTHYTTKDKNTFTEVYPTAAATEESGKIWIGTSGGVYLFDRKVFKRFTKQQGLISNYILSILIDQKQRVWVTTTEGVSCYDGQRFTSYTTAQGLPNNFVMSALEDKSGNLWLGTDEGLSRFDGSSFLNFTIKDGLPDDLIYDIVEGEDGVIWAGTNEGIVGLKFSSPKFGKALGAGHFKVNNHELKKHPLKLEAYNRKTGYPIKDLNTGAMCIKKKPFPNGSKKDIGVIWGGCGDHVVVRFDPSLVHPHKKPIHPFIEAIRINETPINWYNFSSNKTDSATIAQQEVMTYGRELSAQQRDSFANKFKNLRFDSIQPYYPIPENLVLPFNHNRITFDFGTIETSRNFLVQYRYILEGYDAEWSPFSNQTTVSYGNIQEGSYTLKLQARSPEGILSPPLVYHFKVLPPLWRTWWAYGFYFLLLLGSVFLLSNYRSQALKRANRILEEKVALRTKQLEQSVDNLQSTQAQLIQSEKLASLGELTAGIAHEIQNPLNFVNNFAEVSSEMLGEMKEELKAGNAAEVIAIANDLEQNLSKINHHGQRASSIVKGMLEHSRQGRDAMHRVSTDINALADEYLRLAYHGLRAKDGNFNATLETHFDPDLPLVSVIPQDIGRVLLNLISNAFYAVAERSRSTVHQREVEALHATSLQYPPYQPTVTVSTQKMDDQIIIKIQDNGHGIPESIRDKIFQPFFTTKPTGQGTGLGLSLAYDIVTKGHGGTLEVESNVGEGTTFIIRLV